MSISYLAMIMINDIQKVEGLDSKVERTVTKKNKKDAQKEPS